MKLHWTYKRWGCNICLTVFVNYIATTTIPPGFCMFSEVSFRKGMVFYNFADFWTGFAFLVKTVSWLRIIQHRSNESSSFRHDHLPVAGLRGDVHCSDSLQVEEDFSHGGWVFGVWMISPCRAGVIISVLSAICMWMVWICMYMMQVWFDTGFVLLLDEPPSSSC